ncbi:MAG: hypothetical protein HY651_08070 [Acidobacteria bacterium]|nr:hypothetical protein [Acidobacteriota bacterium]
MIPYALWFYWVAARGYRLRPWRSPLLRWRIETYSGIAAEQVTFSVFWKFLWTERRALADFLKWGARMRKLEKQRRELRQS